MTDTMAGEAEYRKTATIKATQWFKMGDHPAVVLKSAPNRYADEGVPWVDTLEGGHVVTPGDWIATGIQGEHWPIKPDVFAATYALAAQPSAGAQDHRAFVNRVGRLPHPADDVYAYPEDDDAERETLNGLIAEAREIMSATPARPDTGAADALREAIEDAVGGACREYSDTKAGKIKDFPFHARAIIENATDSVLAALSTANTQGEVG